MRSIASRRNLKLAQKSIVATKKRPGWTEDERMKFVEACELYGKDYEKITQHVGTKAIDQVRGYTSNFLKELKAKP